MLRRVHPAETSDRGLLEVALEAAGAGAAVLRDQFQSSSLRVRSKGPNDFVSSADHAAEAAIAQTIRAHFPGAAFLGEEGGRSGRRGGELEWIVDPLDGTNNFLQGLPIFCTSVACCRRGEPVAGVVEEPLTGIVYSAVRGGGAWRHGSGSQANAERLRVSEHPGLEGAFLATGFPFRAHAALDLYLAAFRDVFLRSRGVRRCGAAALDLAHTAAGVYDGFFEFRLSPWDLAAGVLLIEEAGGRVSDLDGGRAYLQTGNVVAGGDAVWRELRAVIVRHADEERLHAADPAGGAVA
ncbi:MAG TPA: inositol monophosphatase family protein [Thermoanaerobaculia bacterium]|nr:inositol monophosphatase family protein [Thermoanaerobaculia bacterium]